VFNYEIQYEEESLKHHKVKKSESVARVIKIIEEMAHTKGPLRLQDISRRTNLPASTVLRFLITLMDLNYVSQDSETLRYFLTLRISYLGELVNSQIDLLHIAKPFLIELSKKCKESVRLVIEQDLMVVCISVIDETDTMLKTMTRVGMRIPIHSSSAGKVFMSDYNKTKIDAIVETKGLTALTKNTITSKEELLKEIEKAKINGYAINNEESEYGVISIGAPVKNYKHEIVACITIVGPSSRLSSEKIGQLKNHLLNTSKVVSEQLGYDIYDYDVYDTRHIK
jgi:DNA-binding IclR family transcriptional regulator